jgi:[acyl-carrier-protein] S-malonyltransferase
MEPAKDGLAQRLGRTEPADPRFPVVSNVTAEPVREAGEVMSLLVRQLTSPVRWSASVASMVASGADRFVELGPGRVLCGLNRRNARGMPCTSVGAPEDLDDVDA